MQETGIGSGPHHLFLAVTPSIAYLVVVGVANDRRQKLASIEAAQDKEFRGSSLSPRKPLAHTAGRALAATVAGGIAFVVSLVTVLVINLAVLNWRAPSAFFAALAIASMNACFLGREAVRYLNRPVEKT